MAPIELAKQPLLRKSTIGCPDLVRKLSFDEPAQDSEIFAVNA